MPRPHPPARPHGPLIEVLPDLFVVKGAISIGPTRFSRNMAVVRQGDRLVLINTVRLNDEGLAALDALGTVTDTVRLAGGHGSDDPFYKERYGATVWTLPDQRYFSGIDATKGETYFHADREWAVGAEGPIDGAEVYVLPSSPSEGLLRLPREGGVVISGDLLQHISRQDEYFNLAGKVFMWFAGFLKPYNLGPGWMKVYKPPPEQLTAILDWSFEHVIPAHGEPVLGGAREKFRPVIEAYAGAAR